MIAYQPRYIKGPYVEIYQLIHESNGLSNDRIYNSSCKYILQSFRFEQFAFDAFKRQKKGMLYCTSRAE